MFPSLILLYLILRTARAPLRSLRTINAKPEARPGSAVYLNNVNDHTCLNVIKYIFTK